MNAGKHNAFYFHTDASAFGGVLHHPVRRTITTGASASLPQAGGFSCKKAHRFCLEGLVSFEAAQVVVSGSEDREHGSVRTIATASIERLNILEVVTADRIVAQLSVMHPLDRGPAEISFNGTQFQNLRINGMAVRPRLDRRFFTVEQRKDDLRPGGEEGFRRQHAPHIADLVSIAEAQHNEQSSLREKLVETLGPHFNRSSPLTDLEKKGGALCSLVEKTEVELASEEYGHGLHIPDFGNIFLGQLLVTRFSAQLNLLRVELGCMGDGNISAGSAFSNGRFMP